MKNKALVMVSVLSLVVGLFAGRISRPVVAFARDGEGGEIENATSGSDSRVRTGQGTSSAVRGENDQKDNEENINGTSTAVRGENEEDQKDNNSEEDINDDNGDNGNEHINQVEKITHQLKQVSDEHKNKEVDDDLNEVIGEMASSSKDAAEAIDNLDHEGFAKKLFFGPDFKSLGALRSTIVTTQNHIDRLTKAQEKVTDPAAKATLEVQIAALKDVASSTQQFLDSHERVFSLFGWFLRLFSKD